MFPFTGGLGDAAMPALSKSGPRVSGQGSPMADDLPDLTVQVDRGMTPYGDSKPRHQYRQMEDRRLDTPSGRGYNPRDERESYGSYRSYDRVRDYDQRRPHGGRGYDIYANYGDGGGYASGYSAPVIAGQSMMIPGYIPTAPYYGRCIEN